VNEFPVFVPAEGEHLAAMVTTPEDPVGLVLLLTGLGAPRSHRYQTWTRLARELARRGLASARVDYQGATGDSTGDVPDWGDETGRHMIRQLIHVVETTRRLVGVERVGMVGNCLGAEISLSLASRLPESVGAFAIHLQTRDEWVAPARHVRRTRLAAAVPRGSAVRRIVAPRLRAYQGRAKPYLRAYLAEILSRGRVVLLYDDQDRSYSKQVARRLESMVRSLPEGHAKRFELRIVHATRLPGFETIESQRLAIDLVTAWAGSAFELRDDAATPSEVTPASDSGVASGSPAGAP
jgi:pimeloyl-ACP methyl ester carboxylesterase